MKKGKRFLRSLTALVCMLVLLMVDTAPAMAAKVTQADIDALKGSAVANNNREKKKAPARDAMDLRKANTLL